LHAHQRARRAVAVLLHGEGPHFHCLGALRGAAWQFGRGRHVQLFEAQAKDALVECLGALDVLHVNFKPAYGVVHCIPFGSVREVRSLTTYEAQESVAGIERAHGAHGLPFPSAAAAGKVCRCHRRRGNIFFLG